MPPERFFKILRTGNHFEGKALLTDTEADIVAHFMAVKDRPPQGAGSTTLTKEEDQFLLLGSLNSLGVWEKVVRGTYHYDGRPAQSNLSEAKSASPDRLIAG